MELRPDFGAGFLTALARVEGRPIGVLADDPRHLGGAIDADAADKAARFLQVCNAHGLPVLSLCDTPGFMVGAEAEAEAQVRHAARLFLAAANLAVPLLTIVTRKGYGLGAQAVTGGGFGAPLFTVAWPTAEFGGMSPEGYVALAFRAELEAIADAEERRAEAARRAEEIYARGAPVNLAESFELDDVIDPADSRGWISAALAALPADRAAERRTWIDSW
jgi:acetyl-CoA carboxylase carboxyltransferase component